MVFPYTYGYTLKYVQSTELYLGSLSYFILYANRRDKINANIEFMVV